MALNGAKDVKDHMKDEEDKQNWRNLQQNEQFKNAKYDAMDQIDPRYLQTDRMYLSVSGVIESGLFEDEQTLQIKFSIEAGEDWKKISGNTSGISQLSGANNINTRDIVFNFPFDATYSTSSPSGWPQLVVTLKGPDFFGRSVVKGYGSVHFPTEPGYHERVIRVYRPIPVSFFSGIIGAMLGSNAEYYNAEKVISRGEGRDVTRVQSVGKIKIKFQVMKRNFTIFGYS